MTANQSVLARLSPWFYEPIEDRGTDALAYILNKSNACREALGALLREGDLDLPPIVCVDTQDRSSLRSRPDMVGCDQDAKRRLMVEVKFWAVLQPDQAGRYFEKLEKSGPGVLLFICPEGRIKDLWDEVKAQLSQRDRPVTLGPLASFEGMRHAPVFGCPKRVMMVSWELLLDRLSGATDEFEIRSDIHQLRGLVLRLNEEAVLPLDSNSPESAFGRRDLKLQNLIRDAKDRGVAEDWLSSEGLAGNKRRRYFSVVGARPPWMALSIQYSMPFDLTPVWVMMRKEDWRTEYEREGFRKDKQYRWLPMPIAVGDHPSVLECLLSELNGITDMIKKHDPS